MRKKRRLKDKTWTVAKIKIERIVKQETYRGMTTNKTIM